MLFPLDLLGIETSFLRYACAGGAEAHRSEWSFSRRISSGRWRVVRRDAIECEPKMLGIALEKLAMMISSNVFVNSI